MTRNSSSIPNFVCTYFRFMSDIVRIVNKENESYITAEQLDFFANRDDVPISTLLRLKIAREIDGVYEIDKRVVNFISFSNNEFALSSPESVKKFHYSLLTLYDKLLRATETNDTVRYADQLISELRDFSDILDGSISRLLQETLELKENVNQLSARERFDYASKIIKEYVQPLNEIVEDRSDTILPLIRNISSLAMQKSNSFDRNIENIMRRLRIQADTVHMNTEVFGRQILSELFTLKKIKKTNSILTGAIGWLENYQTLEPKGICNKLPIKVHAKEFFFEAIDELEVLLEEEEDVYIPTEEDLRGVRKLSTYYHFNRDKYIKAIEKEIPINNIFKWLYIEMIENDELTYENYCIALSLFDELRIAYTSEREIITFDSCKLNIPIANAIKLL